MSRTVGLLVLAFACAGGFNTSALGRTDPPTPLVRVQPAPPQPISKRGRALIRRARAALAPQRKGPFKLVSARLAREVARWARNQRPSKSQRARVGEVVAMVRAVRRAPAPALGPGRARRLVEQLEPLTGTSAARSLLAEVQRALLRELDRLLLAARRAKSNPRNRERFNFRGRRFAWGKYKTRAMPKEVGPAVKPGRVLYGRYTVSDGRVRRALARIARRTGRDVVVTSGDRSYVPPGGSATSWHLRGRAADFYVRGSSLGATFALLRREAATLLSEGTYEIIWHGVSTHTGGPHIHLGNRAPGRNQFKVENHGRYTYR